MSTYTIFLIFFVLSILKARTFLSIKKFTRMTYNILLPHTTRDVRMKKCKIIFFFHLICRIIDGWIGMDFQCSLDLLWLFFVLRCVGVYKTVSFARIYILFCLPIIYIIMYVLSFKTFTHHL